MQDSDYQKLLETAARRALTAAEQGRLDNWFELHPEDRVEWEIERRLDGCLRRLPDVPVPSNFTTQVLQQADRTSPPRTASSSPGWLQWLRDLGYGWQTAALTAALALVLAVQFQQARHRAELTQSLREVPVAGLADVEVWRNFELINSLPTEPLPSVEQLAEAVK